MNLTTYSKLVRIWKNNDQISFNWWVTTLHVCGFCCCAIRNHRFTPHHEHPQFAIGFVFFVLRQKKHDQSSKTRTNVLSVSKAHKQTRHCWAQHLRAKTLRKGKHMKSSAVSTHSVGQCGRDTSACKYVSCCQLIFVQNHEFVIKKYVFGLRHHCQNRHQYHRNNQRTLVPGQPFLFFTSLLLHLCGLSTTCRFIRGH